MRYAILLLLSLLAPLACEGDREEEQPTPSPAATSLSPTPTPAAAVDTLAFIRDGDILLINADGTDERRLNLSGVESFSWVSSDELDVVTGADQSGHLLVDLEGNAEPLPFRSGGSWSRDGTLYVVPVDEQVVVFNRDGSEAARLDVEPPVETGEKPRQCGPGGSPDRLVFSRPEFSSDQQSILVVVNCVSRAGATGNLYAPVVSVLLVDGTQRQTDLQTNLEDGIGANVAPDGSRVAQFIRFGGSACSSDYSLFVADADGANAQELTLPAISDLGDVRVDLQGGLVSYDWSPDSDAVVASFNASLCRTLEEDPYLREEPVVAGLYILRLDGSPEEKLVDGPTHSPAWSPSSRYIAHVSQEYFGQEIGPPLLRVIDLTTREVNDLAEGVQPAWQPLP